MRTYIHLAELKLAEGYPNEAIENYEHVIKEDDKYLAAYLGLGQYYLSISSPEKVLPPSNVLDFSLSQGKPYLKKVIELDPDHTDALVGLSVFSYMEVRTGRQ